MKKLVILFLLISACSDDANSNNKNNGRSNNGTSSNNGTASNNGTTADNGTTANNGTTPKINYSVLVINEVAASGDPEDWFEIYNPSDQEIDMTGVGYTDDLGDIRKALLRQKIGPKSFIKIEVSVDSAGFKLGRDEELGLFAPDGSEIDSVDWVDGNSPANKSYGRFPDGSGEFKTLNSPTPGAANIDNNPNDPICGDMKKEGDEACDASEFAGKTCQGEGFASGDLTCSPDCLAISTETCVAEKNDIVINEVTSAGDDIIELYNSGAAAVDLSAWYIVDAGYLSPADVDHRFDFPNPSMLAAGEFLVLTKGVQHSFGIGGKDTITLYDADDKIIDQTTWPDSNASLSWCRQTDGDGDFQSCSTASFGSSNTP